MFPRSPLSAAEIAHQHEMYHQYYTAAKKRGEHDVADYYKRILVELEASKPDRNTHRPR